MGFLSLFSSKKKKQQPVKKQQGKPKAAEEEKKKEQVVEKVEEEPANEVVEEEEQGGDDSEVKVQEEEPVKRKSIMQRISERVKSVKKVDEEPKLGPEVDLFQWFNQKWFSDPELSTNPEYPRWGSFMQLREKSINDQITLLKEISSLESPDEDQAKMKMIWDASMQRFENFENGKGDYSPIESEFSILDSNLSDADGYLTGLAKQILHCQVSGINGPFNFGAMNNLSDSNKMVLAYMPYGILTLPTRDHYLSEQHAPTLQQYKEHLETVGKVVDLVEDEDFAERVLRFETKVAQISLTSAQFREYDTFYSLTNLDDFVSEINDLKGYEKKHVNYENNKADEGDHDYDLVTKPEWLYDDEQKAKAQEFFDAVFKLYELRETMEANAKKHYGDDVNDPNLIYSFMVIDGDFLRRVFSLFGNEENKSDLRCYLQYQIIRACGHYCTKELHDEMFNFFDGKLQGSKKEKAPVKQTTELISSWVGEMVGQVYVEKHFPESEKQNVKNMINKIIVAMEESLKTNDWLTEETKEKARKKLDTFNAKIGYPDKWTDYSRLVFDSSDTFYDLKTKVSEFDHKKEFLDKISTQVDLAEWGMPPQMVNAYFNPSMNEIVFPAAILQPPFYYKSLDEVTDVDFELGGIDKNIPGILDALNFGGIGGVIAHEISHGFDDQGRKYDHEGNLVDWWIPEDAELFAKKAALMKAQAERWTFEEKVEGKDEPVIHRMNGDLCMGENLADIGGTSLAYQGMAKTLGDSMTRDHIRALVCNWATVWKSTATQQYTVMLLALDPHAPSSFRGNSIANLDAFYEAYDVKEGDPMYIPPEERVRMW